VLFILNEVLWIALYSRFETSSKYFSRKFYNDSRRINIQLALFFRGPIVVELRPTLLGAICVFLYLNKTFFEWMFNFSPRYSQSNWNIQSTSDYLFSILTKTGFYWDLQKSSKTLKIARLSRYSFSVTENIWMSWTCC
jgi:hypothetical protein